MKQNDKIKTAQAQQAEDNSPPLMERFVFGNRVPILIGFLIITIFLGYQASKLRPDASFLKMIPTYHPYIKNYLAHKEDLKGLGNVVYMAVETTDGDIFSAEYLDTLQKINDAVFFVKGVNRGVIKSLWTPLTRWLEVNAEGFDGGPVIPDTYDGSQASCDTVRFNVMRSGEIGTLVANNFKSSIVVAPLLDVDPKTGKPLDYWQLSKDLEAIRDKYQTGTIKIHIVGFAKIVGDLIEGANRVGLFFIFAFVLLLAILYYNSRCWRSTWVRGVSSMIAVIWQMGLLQYLGYGLNPYSMLVPFLMFALGVSHGIQMFNAMAIEMIKGADKLLGSRRAFRSIYIPGFAALFTDCVGFAILFVIQIGVIQDIAIGASIGVAIVAFTDLTLLPVLMSYTGICPNTLVLIEKRAAGTNHPLWNGLSNVTRPKIATAVILIGVLAFGIGSYIRQDLKTGDIDPGAPELRPDSRYNLDNAFIVNNYSTSSDLFVVMVEKPGQPCGDYETLVTMDNLQWELEHLPGVQSVYSMLDDIKKMVTGFNEADLKYRALNRALIVNDNALVHASQDVVSRACDLGMIRINLDDHKAETLERVVRLVEKFAAENNTEKVKFLMGAGNAGIEAATNIEVKKAQVLMTVLVFAVIFVVCIMTFRSVKGALCVVLPLYLTSVLCEALMTMMGIGIKVATLPVIAVGVGIGVDYGIYMFNKYRYYRESGYDLTRAYYHTLNTTGRAVIFTGITLSIGVCTWVFSPIKFQADMGLLLTFMFLVNLIGAAVFMPAIASLIMRDKKQPSESSSPVEIPAEDAA
ncbi:MAG: RND family transporter [Deltaproteobacteria bacterium]|nr:RND family transporter [Deltaproteobacteria bacterium]